MTMMFMAWVAGTLIVFLVLVVAGVFVVTRLLAARDTDRDHPSPQRLRDSRRRP